MTDMYRYITTDGQRVELALSCRHPRNAGADTGTRSCLVGPVCRVCGPRLTHPLQRSVRYKDYMMDLTNWLKTPNINIDFRENYGTKLLVGPPGGGPSFKLEPKKLCNPFGEDQVVQFRLKYNTGCMLHNWAELLFTPLGSEPMPPLPKKLPPWSPDKEPEYAAGARSADRRALSHRDAAGATRSLPAAVHRPEPREQAPADDRSRAHGLSGRMRWRTRTRTWCWWCSRTSAAIRFGRTAPVAGRRCA